MTDGLIMHSPLYYAIAKRAYERAMEEAEHDRSWGSQEPLISIVFAAAAAEAFIDEIGELASLPSLPYVGLSPGLGPQPDQVRNLARVLTEAEDARVTTQLKYLLAKLALTGEACTDRRRMPPVPAPAGMPRHSLAVEYTHAMALKRFGHGPAVRLAA